MFTDIDLIFYKFLKTPNPFSRENRTGHITGSCWILSKDRRMVLLTHHKKLNIWIPPGGHSEGEMDPLQIALREGEEETGLKLRVLSNEPFRKDIHIIPQYQNVPPHKHYDYTYVFEADNNLPLILSKESIDLKWIPLKDIEIYSQEINVLEMKNKTEEFYGKQK